jgi:hypothetical protein
MNGQPMPITATSRTMLWDRVTQQWLVWAFAALWMGSPCLTDAAEPKATAEPKASTEPKSKVEEAQQRWFAECQADMAASELFERTTKSEAKPVELLKWVNVTRSDQLGLVSGWVRSGRVVAVSTVFSSRPQVGEVVLSHEWVNLSGEPLRANMNGRMHWEPKANPMQFQKLAEAPVPEASRAGRLRQLRALSREFTAHSVSPYTNAPWDLRMLPQPLYRYEDPADPATAAVVDGALFTFVSNAGTDPEIFLLFEAQRQGNNLVWNWSAGRFSDHSLYLKRNDQDFWTFKNVDGNVTYLAGANDAYRWYQYRVIADGLKE